MASLLPYFARLHEAIYLCVDLLNSIRKQTETVLDEIQLYNVYGRLGARIRDFHHDTGPEATLLPTEPRARSY